MLKKDGFVSLETIVVAAVVICLSMYALTKYQVVGPKIVDSFIVTIDETINAASVEDGSNDGSNGNDGENETAPNWVMDGKKYSLGDIVVYKGKEYVCTYEHTTNGDLNWAPDVRNNLWKIK